MFEKICWPDGFRCDAQLSSPHWRILVRTSRWLNSLTATRWVPLMGAARVIYRKDPLLNDMKASNVFPLNIFSILCLMYKCKQNISPPVFGNTFIHRRKTKYELRNENFIQEPLCGTNFRQYCISYVDPTFRTK